MPGQLYARQPPHILAFLGSVLCFVECLSTLGYAVQLGSDASCFCPLAPGSVARIRQGVQGPTSRPTYNHRPPKVCSEPPLRAPSHPQLLSLGPNLCLCQEGFQGGPRPLSFPSTSPAGQRSSVSIMETASPSSSSPSSVYLAGTSLEMLLESRPPPRHRRQAAGVLGSHCPRKSLSPS